MLKSQVTTGALIPFCCRNSREQPKDRCGSSSFANVNVDSEYTERTITLGEPKITKRDDGKFDASIEIERFGDSMHTLILKNASVFDRYEFVGYKNDAVAYREGMSYGANMLLAEAGGWEFTPQTFPLVIGMTTDYKKNHLPIFKAFGDVGNSVSCRHCLNVQGLESESAAQQLQLDVDFVYFETITRKDLASQDAQSFQSRNVCNFYTTRKNSAVENGMCNIPMVEGRDANWFKIDNVTGIILDLKTENCVVEEVSMYINNHQFCAWKSDDRHIYWKKVGLKKPKEAILLPFSRSMWTSPDKAAFLDFSHIDTMHFLFKCSEDAEELEVDITALGYKTRVYDETCHIFRSF